MISASASPVTPSLNLRLLFGRRFLFGSGVTGNIDHVIKKAHSLDAELVELSLRNMRRWRKCMFDQRR